jgi:hypothetical protein
MWIRIKVMRVHIKVMRIQKTARWDHRGGGLTVSAGSGPGGEEGVLVGLCPRVHSVRLILAGPADFPHAEK